MKTKANYATNLGLGGCDTCRFSSRGFKASDKEICMTCDNYSNHSLRKMSRIDLISRNGNDGEHYYHQSNE